MSLDAPLASAADWTEAGPLAEMTPADHERREVLVATVWRHLDGFMEAGAALVEIRDSRLYRDTHPTFAAFCKDEFSLSRSGAYELMTAAEVVSGIPDTAPRPQNIGQANALAAADPAERADVMAAVAGKGKPTAAAIADEIESRKPPAPTPESLSVETERDGSSASPASPTPGVQVESEDDRCEKCGYVTPDVSGGWCAECWQDTDKSPDPVPLPAPQPPKLRDLPEVKAVDRLWSAEKALGKALRSFPSVDDVMAELPADSLESFDHLADEAAAWAKKWKEDRKSATRLRLMGVKGIKR